MSSRGILCAGFLLISIVVVPVGPVAGGAGGTPTPAMPAPRRLIRPTLPPAASQADAGAQVYTLVCSACHGDLGQGLTDEWRATWHPRDQNCWQAKCHGANRPPDGFDLPRYIPPVVGPAVAGRFRTAGDLFAFIRQTMPWQEPASLQEDEYWDATAFVLKLNDVDPGPDRLDYQRASSLLLNPRATLNQAATQPASTLTPTPAPPTRSQTSPLLPWPLAIVLFIGCGATLVAVRRRAARTAAAAAQTSRRA